MNENKVIPENWLLCVNFVKLASINEDRSQSQPSKRSIVIGRGFRISKHDNIMYDTTYKINY